MILKSRTFILGAVSLLSIMLFSQFKPNSLQSLYKVEYNRFWTYKVHSGKKFNMIVIGDSRTYRGISPMAMNKSIPGIRINNFGFSSGILDKEIFTEAEKRIDQSADCKIILIGVTPGDLTDQENKHFHDLAKMTHSEVFDNIYMRYYFSKYLLPVKPSEFLEVDTNSVKAKLTETFNDDGWVASESKEYNHKIHLKSYEEFWSKNKVSHTKINDLLLKINDWNSNGYKVFAFRVPASVEIDSLENCLSGFDENSLSESIRKAGGHWILLKDKYSRYSSYDGIHMDESSALILSRDIGEEINKFIPNHK